MAAITDNVWLKKQHLTSLANSLREATDSTASFAFPEDFDDAIRRLANSSGYVLPALKNPASENQILAGYDVIGENGAVKEGTMPVAAQATPEIDVLNNGLITVSAEQQSGYVEAGTKTETRQLPTQAAKTVIPTTSEQTAVSSGLYTTGAVKVAAMPTATQATPTISVDANGKITATSTQSAGYVSSGTKTASKQLSTQAAKTVIPTTSEQTAVSSGLYTTGAVKVAAMPTATQATPTISVNANGMITASATQAEGYVTAGTKSISTQLTVKGATTITPGTSNQTVASGTYLTGALTIAGASSLVAGNIKSGVSIFGVTGTYGATYDGTVV